MLPDRSIWTKIGEKCPNSNATVLVIFQQNYPQTIREYQKTGRLALEVLLATSQKFPRSVHPGKARKAKVF